MDRLVVIKIALVVCIVVLSFVTFVLINSGARKNSRISNLHSSGKTVEVTFTTCEGLLGGSGSNPAGYTCYGSFTLGGHNYVETIPGLNFRYPGSKIAAVVIPGDPGSVTPASSLTGQHSSPSVYVLPVLLLLVDLLLIGVFVRRLRMPAPAASMTSKGATEGTTVPVEGAKGRTAVAPASTVSPRASATPRQVVQVGAMEKRRLGSSGLLVSIAGLGCNNFGMRIDQDRTTEVVTAAIDCGITFFDTARSYGGGLSEEYLGVALKGHREDVVIATKFGSARIDDRGSRSEVIRSTEQSLRALGTDYIDLLQFHFPDPHTPIEETLDALDGLVRSGKVRYIGCSNCTGWMIADAAWTARTRNLAPFVSLQNQWSLLRREIEAEVTEAAERFGLGVLPFFPLASGLLTGKVGADAAAPQGSRLADSSFNSVITDANLDKVERLRKWSAERGWTPTRLALSWLASHGVVSSVIAGATSPDQVRENVASTVPDLTAAEIAEVSSLVD